MRLARHSMRPADEPRLVDAEPEAAGHQHARDDQQVVDDDERDSRQVRPLMRARMCHVAIALARAPARRVVVRPVGRDRAGSRRRR